MKARIAAAAFVAVGMAVSVTATASAGVAGADKVMAKLTGDQVVSGEGDPNGKGTFKAWVEDGELCYTLKVQKVARLTGAHIHAGEAGTEGAIVATLEAGRRAEGCLPIVADGDDTESTLSESELAALLDNPSGYYVDVHNDLNPGGAIRGQLR